jgi:hypothetical protein
MHLQVNIGLSKTAQHMHCSTIASIESSFWCWTILKQPLDPYLTITWLWYSHITHACLKIQWDDYSSIFAWLLDDFTRRSHDCTWLFTFTEVEGWRGLVQSPLNTILIFLFTSLWKFYFIYSQYLLDTQVKLCRVIYTSPLWHLQHKVLLSYLDVVTHR